MKYPLLLLSILINTIYASGIDDLIMEYETLINVKLLESNVKVEKVLGEKFSKTLGKQNPRTICVKVLNGNNIFYIEVRTTLSSSFENATQFLILNNKPKYILKCKEVKAKNPVKTFFGEKRTQLLMNFDGEQYTSSSRVKNYDYSIMYMHSRYIKKEDVGIRKMYNISMNQGIRWILYEGIDFQFIDNKIVAYNIHKNIEGLKQ